MSIFHNILNWLDDATYVWRQELKHVFRDEGVLMFCIVVPLGYPLLYSWIYNNETVHEVPVVVVDQSKSQESRQFIRMCDASADVKVACYAVNLDEAKSLVGRQVVKGIYYIPEDFATRLNRMEQSTISVYCDMSLMLTYKAIYQTALAVTTGMGTAIKKQISGNYTARDDLVSTSPLKIEEVSVFNPTGGYGSSVIPAVLMLIIQQTLALGVGMAAGTARERNRYSDLVPINRCWQNLLLLMIPFLLACVFFAQTISCLVHYRENVILLMVFVSLPLLFMSGVSWPQSSIPSYWQGVSWLFPSTFGIRAYIRLNSMGATIADVSHELICLWTLVAFYFITACIVYGVEMRLSKQHAQERLEVLRKKREVRLQFKGKKNRSEAK